MICSDRNVHCSALHQVLVLNAPTSNTTPLHTHTHTRTRERTLVSQAEQNRHLVTFPWEQLFLSKNHLAHFIIVVEENALSWWSLDVKAISSQILLKNTWIKIMFPCCIQYLIFLGKIGRSPVMMIQLRQSGYEGTILTQGSILHLKSPELSRGLLAFCSPWQRGMHTNTIQFSNTACSRRKPSTPALSQHINEHWHFS